MLRALARRAVCRILGFDLVHAWRNRKEIRSADVIWAHTEREHMAAIALLLFTPRSKRPRIIAQCIWLFDEWPRLSVLRQKAYGRLLKEADVITTLSPDNLNAARQALPASRTRLMMFGINTDCMKRPQLSPCRKPVRIAALGSDRHRDWSILLDAFGGAGEFEVRIATSAISRDVVERFGNVSVEAASSNSQVEELYKWADIVVVPLKKNLHASGLSVILEATIYGLPVIATDTGGLRAYFSDSQICYVPVGDALAMRGAALELARREGSRVELAIAAQRRLIEGGITSEMYAQRHRDLTLELIDGTREKTADSRSPCAHGSHTTAAPRDAGRGSDARM